MFFTAIKSLTGRFSMTSLPTPAALAVTPFAGVWIEIVFPKKTSLGKVATASTSDASGEYSVSYFATYLEGKKVLEIDPLNYIFFVNGKDYLAEVRRALGK